MKAYTESRKHIIAVILLLMPVILICVSCGENRSTVQPGGNNNTQNESVTPAPVAEPTPEPEDPMKAKIIIIAGQSNAVGATQHSCIRENHGKDVYKKYKTGYENVKIAFYCEPGGPNGENANTNIRIKYGETLDNIFHKVTLGQSWNSIYFGPEVGMAEYLGTNYPDDTFYIIKVAKGDVSIPSHWQDGGGCSIKFVETMQTCLNALKNEGYHPEIISICWMQGENDASNDELTAAYADNLAGLAEWFRKNYAEYAPAKGIPFIDAGISSYWKNYKQINEIKKQFADSSDINYYFDTMAEGLTYDKEPTPVDPYHFDSDSMLRLGELFAEYTMNAR